MIDPRLKGASDNIIELIEDGGPSQKKYLETRLKHFEEAFKLYMQLKGVKAEIIELAIDSGYKPKDFKNEIEDLKTALSLLPAYNRLNEDELDELFEHWGVY